MGAHKDHARSGRVLTILWVAGIAIVGILWLADPSAFTPDAVSARLTRLGTWAWIGFGVVSVVRGVLLIPSTPFVLAGGALFPDQPLPVFLISMLGICTSAALLYRFPGLAGYDSRLAARYPGQLARLQEQLAKPRAQWFVALWAFFPAVPTDLICYAAGLVRMPFHRLMLGIVMGEVPLVAAYVLLGTRVADLWPF